MGEFQSEDAPAIQDFLQWLSKPTSFKKGCKGSDNAIGPQYIPEVALKAYLTTERIKSLLTELFENTTIVPPNADRIRTDFLRPFAILLSAELGRFIRHFVDYGYRDHRLPFFHEPNGFPKHSSRDLFIEFCQKQWQFCPMQLDWDMSDHLESEYILPITEKREINRGGSSILYKITVDEDYNNLNKGTFANTELQQPKPNIFALKTYRTPEAPKYFENERNAFIKLRYGDKPHRDIIAFYGSFVREGTYNLILEYADRGTLDDYMDNTPEPKSISDIMMFWERWFGVIRGLAHIHGTQGSGPDSPNTLIGWHHDIDPSNILVVSRSHSSLYDCEFKIADFGLAHFKRYDTSLHNATDNNRYGTNTYGAPETHRSRDLQTLHLQVPQNADIWSLGCVLSEVATWITFGRAKLLEYRRQRKKEIGEKSSTIANEDCFHHRWEVLETVEQIHNEIEDSGRKSDYVTPCVVNKLVKGMMRADPRLRAGAQYHLKSSAEIFSEAKIKLKKAIPSSPTPTPGHTVSDPHIDVRRPRLPPNLPPGQEHRIPADPSNLENGFASPLQAAELRSSPPGLPWQDPDQLQQVRAVRGLQLDGMQDGESPIGGQAGYFTAQHRDPHLHHPAQRNFSHPTSSIAQNQQNARSFTETAGTMGIVHPDSRPLVPIADASETTNISILPLRPRDSRNKPNGVPTPGVMSANQASQFANREPATPVGSHQTGFQDRQPAALDTRTSPMVDGQPSHHQRPYIAMSVKEGLSVKRAKRYSNIKYPNEDIFHSTDDILKNRDHVYLVDNGQTMVPHRKQVEEVVELLSSLTGPYDPNGLDLYFSTEAIKYRPKTPEEFLKCLRDRPAHGQPDFRQRFADIIEKYKSRFGKRNWDKLRHFRSTPSNNPRPLSLYVLTDGVWDPKCTLITEIKNLVASLLEHKLPNKYVGIQFIRFGNDTVGRRRLKTLDARLHLELDVVDETSADGNVWKMLLGAVNDWYDDDHDEDTDDEDGPSDIR